MIIAIDGPAGSGKSTIARLLAKQLDILYIDTGAMYRALTLKAMQSGIDLKDEDALIDLAKNTHLKLTSGASGKIKVFIDGKDVSEEIRTPHLTNNVSYVANIEGVRRQMVRLQRSTGIGAKNGAVLEGRDIGTVVFPDANKKFYLDANIKERSRRRYKELLKKHGIKTNLTELQKDIKIRDKKDKTRKAGALKKADDAIFINTTNLTIKQVLKKIISCLK